MKKGKLYLCLIMGVLALLFFIGFFYEPGLSLLVLVFFPIPIVIYFITKDENKGNLPKDVDSYNVVWKDSTSIRKKPGKNIKYSSCTIYKEGIGYLNYFAKYSEIKRIIRKGNITPLSKIAKFILSFFPIGGSLSMGSGFKLAKSVSKSLNIPEQSLDSLKIITKNKIIIFQVGDFGGFRKNLEALGQGHLFDESLKK